MHPEEFIREYFRERTERIRAELVNREPFRKKFYASDCLFDSRRNDVEFSEGEEILEVLQSNAGKVQVITRKPPVLGRHLRARYHLKASGDAWLIFTGEFECGICHATGKKKDGKTE